MTSIPDALAGATSRLRAAGIEAPRREARWLLAHVLGVSPVELLSAGGVSVPDAFGVLVARRAAREPLAYITGRAEFWSLPFAVSPATLIPRADSETLLEAALAEFADRSVVRRVLDLGTGTGCLLLAALTEFRIAWGLGVDRAPEAAALAAGNAAALGLGARSTFLAADWDSALGLVVFDLILSNPPYIPSADIPALMPEVAVHEPASALDGGADGLNAYRRVAAACDRLLTPGGRAILELGIGQADQVAAIARQRGFLADIRPDLSGIPRALILRRAPS